jgi:6-phosphogluconolactonase
LRFISSAIRNRCIHQKASLFPLRKTHVGAFNFERKVMQHKTLSLLSLLLAILVSTLLGAQTTQNAGIGSSGGYVYVMTNQPSTNAVIQYQRSSAGQLSQLQQISTQGVGSGGTKDPLGSQNSLVLSDDGRLLLAVNAGSNDVSVLSAGASGLQFLSKTPSGGTFPNSLAMSGNLIYVLNAKGTPNITGFRLAASGTLTAIPNSTRNLPGGAGSKPADVRFSQDGTLLLVTESMTNQIDVFPLQDGGLTGEILSIPSLGQTPFGVNFANRDRVIVTEAGSASLSSYSLTDSDGLAPISASVPNGQLASCWVAVTNDRTYAYISNTGSGTISSYSIDQHGDLTLANPTAGLTGPTSAPIDSAMSDDSQYLYVLESTFGRIAMFSVNGASLTSMGTVNGLPNTIQGIAAQ